MASDLSSIGTEVIEILDEKEEGEISLEDVSSSEEGQLNDGCNSRRRIVGQCPTCLSTKHCAAWCFVPTKQILSKSSGKKDAVQEKENCHHTKDSGYSGSKHGASKLQENNNDLIPISSDSDMEIVGLADSVKQALVPPQAKTVKVRKRRKKRRSQNTSTVSVPVDAPLHVTSSEYSVGPKHDSQILKDNHLPRMRHRESNSPHKNTGSMFTRSKAVQSPFRRYRSPIGRPISPFTKSRSPPVPPRSPVLRKSPIHRPRSPTKRSSPQSPLRSPTSRQFDTSIYPSKTCIDMYGNVSKLLKIRHLKTVGSQSDCQTGVGKLKGQGASLQDKLNNMMKGDNRCNDPPVKTNNEKCVENIDDDEDLELLRKMALDTKPKHTERTQEVTEDKEDKQCENNNIEDDDVEDLELRMIALRSAMLKKHRDRKQRGAALIKTQKPKTLPCRNTESPFSQSFLDSIPIPGEDSKVEFKTPPHSPTGVLKENIHPEDMELDSEVELEKEGTQPYSPTDEISQKVNIDTDLLSIQSSDVSFVTQSDQNTPLSNSSTGQIPLFNMISSLESETSYFEGKENHLPISKNPSYLNANAKMLPISQSPEDTPNSLQYNFCTPPDKNILGTPYSPSQPIETPSTCFLSQNDSYVNSDLNQTPETPYSPTDTPIYDPELNNALPLLNAPPFQKSDMITKPKGKKPKENYCKKQSKKKFQRALIQINLVSNLSTNQENFANIDSPTNSLMNREYSPQWCHDKIELGKSGVWETSSIEAEVGSPFGSSTTNSSDSTMIVVDELPETDLDGSPLVPVPSTNLQDIVIHIPSTVSQEPLYLQGVPDVTKDANKIPTLVNRSLVPVPILKSNKNLQQPLPRKRIEAHLEPAFKSAEMQPVQISTEPNATNRLFKPIKLAPVVKKSQLRRFTPAAFNCSSNDNSIVEDQDGLDSTKPEQAIGRKEPEIFLEKLQNGHTTHTSNKMKEATNTASLENGLHTIAPVKSAAFPTLEPRPNAVQDQAKNNDAFKISDKDPVKSVQGNVDSKKKARSRRAAKRKNKHLNQTTNHDKSIETKVTSTNISKATAIERAASIDTCSLHKETTNSNETNTNYSSQDADSRKRDSRDKSRKSGTNKSKRDPDRRSRTQPVSEHDNKWRKSHKYDKVSNDNKKLDISNVEMVIQNEPRIGSSKSEGWSSNSCEYRCRGKDKIDNITKAKELSSPLDISKNVTNEKQSCNVTNNIGEQRMPASMKTNDISNVPLSCNTENTHVKNSALVSNNRTQDSEVLVDTNASCNKVEASKRRRSSLDEDEDALRAVLLASLAKRSKPSEVPNTTTKATASTNLSHGSGNTSTESDVCLLHTHTPITKVSIENTNNSSSKVKPPLIKQDTSNLNNSSDKNPNLQNVIHVKVSEAPTGKNNVPKNVTYDEAKLSTAPTRKRSISTSVSSKAPPKKIAKKVPIPASTKVVNNAKKYQNTLVQKKLNLQKVSTTSNAQKALGTTNLHTKNIMDGSRTRSVITHPLSDTQRFVINLASDSESENETELPIKDTNEPPSNNGSEQKPVLAIPMSVFEKSVDLFLKDVREKQESAAAIKPSTATIANVQKSVSPATSVHRTSPVLSTTPLAVRHLPVSQQEEYRRLKQQILVREKLKLQRVAANNASPLSPSSKSIGTPPGPLSPASPLASPSMSKQNHNIPLKAQSPVVSAAKDSNSKIVSVQSNTRNVVPSAKTKISPMCKMNVPITSVSNLSIQIPNATTNVNLACKTTNNSYIPVSASQTRLVTATKLAQVNTKNSIDSTVSAKEQLDLKNVQVQLRQGQTGRRVSLGKTFTLCTETVVPQDKVPEPSEPATLKTSINMDSNRIDKITSADVTSSSVLAETTKTIDVAYMTEKSNNLVDSAALTLIITREEENSQNRTLVDSSASTLIISRNTSVDVCGVESVNTASSNVNRSPQKSSTSGPKKLKNNKDVWEKVRRDVRQELDEIATLSSSEQKAHLATVEQNLVKKRYAIVDDLSEISENLRQLEMEREVQAKMALEVNKLQEQLRLAQEKLQMQRYRVNKMVPSITATYEKVNSRRRECGKMTRICLGLGHLVVGAKYKIPAAGAQLLNNRLKLVAGCTRQLSKKKTSVTESTDEAPSKLDLQNQTSTLENCLSNALSESTPRSIHENSTGEGDVAETIGNVTLTECRENCDTEFITKTAEKEIDIANGETAKIDNKTSLAASDDPPQLTSTPNSSKHTPSMPEYVNDSGESTSTFVLDIPRAGISGNDRFEHRRYLLPYESELTHLSVPRTADPTGILCPYELMGTCRDEDCQFVHQSARNS